MHVLPEHARVFDGIKPWTGIVPEDFTVDFVGTLTDVKFRTIFPVNPALIGGKGGTHVATRLPTIEDGEGWFEAFNWVEAARAARHRFVMVTLGACYGAQAIGSHRTLQSINPMPSRLVAVEPEPENFAWVAKNMRDNGIDPDEQWLINAAIGDSNAPVLFPVGWPGLGAQNSYSTNELAARKVYAKQALSSGRAAEMLEKILLSNSTGIKRELVKGERFLGEIKFVSTVTLRDVLAPFDTVDYLESDIQQSEILVFPPFMDLLKRKVRRIHIGTHGQDVHDQLAGLFRKHGWAVVFDYRPNMSFETPLGNFSTNDGVLTVLNVAL